MKNKTKIYLILLGLTILSIPILKLMENNEKKIRIVTIDSSKIKKISIKNKEGNIDLALENEKWMITEPIKVPADSNKIKNIFNDIFNKEIASTPLSTKKEFHNKFNVTDSLGTTFTIETEKDKQTFIVGRSKNYNTSYIRKLDSNDVYLIPKNLSADHLTTQKSVWRSPDVFKINTKKIKKIEINNPKQNYTIVSENSKWVLEAKNTKFDIIKNSNPVFTKILNRVSNIFTYQFLDNQFEKYTSDFNKTKYKITITDIDGNITNFKFVKDKSKILCLKNNETKHLAILTSSFLENLNPDYNELKKGKTGN